MFSYQAAIEQLNSMVPELYVSGNAPRRKFSLEEVRILLEELGNPHFQFSSVLVAGTNGKGSTAATLSSILTVAGLRTGLYTSPHLARVNERIRLGSVEIADDQFADLFFRVLKAAERLVARGSLAQLPSFFEVLTALAFCFFAESGVQIAVLEVGMGGRLDATNVVEPLVSVVTDIALDHMEWLGSTLALIAREKAGILRRGGSFVWLKQEPDVNQVLSAVAEELGTKQIDAAGFLPHPGLASSYPLRVLGSDVLVEPLLMGEHQHRNIALAIAAAVELSAYPQFASIDTSAIVAGVHQTRWPGRLERISAGGRDWILDVAHNPAGALVLASSVRTIIRYDPKPALLFSCLRDKPLQDLASILFPLFDPILLAPIQSLRAASLPDLQNAAQRYGRHSESFSSIEEAVRRASRGHQQTIVVSGSVYLVGAVRQMILEMQK